MVARCKVFKLLSGVMSGEIVPYSGPRASASCARGCKWCGHLVRYFLKWTHQRGLSRRLVVPTIPRQQPAELLDDDERWRLLHRCLTDTALPVDVRAAGLPAAGSYVLHD